MFIPDNLNDNKNMLAKPFIIIDIVYLSFVCCWPGGACPSYNYSDTPNPPANFSFANTLK